MTDPGRRPLKTRAAGWSRTLAGSLASRRISPDAISVTGLGFAVLGAVCLALAAENPHPWPLLLAAAACIQLRLLANMLDGMVAVEGGRGGPLGGVYNEFPDRLEDALLIVAAGYAAASAPWSDGELVGWAALSISWPPGEILGWAAAAMALLTAYTRALGASLGVPDLFHGPMAKPHRMFLLTLGCLSAAVAPSPGAVLYVMLVLMTGGMLVTVVRRLRALSTALRAA